MCSVPLVSRLRTALRAAAAAHAALLAFTLAGCASQADTAPASRGAPAEAPWRVATWNIRHGLGMDKRVDLERTAQVLKSLDADLIALEEMDEKTARCGGVDQAAWLGEQLGMHHAFGEFMPHDSGRYGLALLSRDPIVHTESWRLPDGNEPRVALAATIRRPSGALVTVVVVHFDWVKDDSFRFPQATETIRRLGTVTTPWVVLGDFNDTRGSRTMDAFEAIGRTCKNRGPRSMTFPSDTPDREIDFIVVGPASAWDVRGASVVEESMASDHRPVVACILAVVLSNWS